MGFEPTTYALRMRRSTPELSRHAEGGTPYMVFDEILFA
ncbi:MAG: hypothetical protein ACD_28C00157G0002 [uncultured bacterium]|nr:MAG: hypothetical protein ACD_28C00157G0002 [uncultured bacterium]